MNRLKSAAGWTSGAATDAADELPACPWNKTRRPVFAGLGRRDRPAVLARACCSFARTFRAWRHQRGLTRPRVAAELDLPVDIITAWEHGRCLPTDGQVDLLLVYTGLPPCHLFCLQADDCRLAAYARHEQAWSGLRCTA